MANSASHGSLPYPIKGARYTVLTVFMDADGDPLDPTTPDTEVSKDGAAFADAAEEVTTITGSNGMGYLTLSGAETDCSMLGVAFKVASGPKATLMTLYPRVLPILESGTAQAGAAGTITLAAGAAAYTLTGCFVKTTGGTGGGGTGGANNQARLITAYNKTTKVATVSPNWETNPASGTTYDILLPSDFQGLVLDMATLAEINTQMDTAITDARLGELVAVTSTAPVTGSLFHKVMSKNTGSFAYDQTTDALEAIRDRGDAAWTTGGGGSITDLLNVTPLIPESIDLANTATWRIGLMLTNALDDLPTTAEITPGTISIERKAIGGTAWSAVVTDAACSESAGLVYFDEVFDAATGYAEGDSIRVTFKNQLITVAANAYEISDATGRLFYTTIRQNMAGVKAKTDQLTFTGTLRVDANLEAVNNDTASAVNLRFSASTIVRGAAVSGTLSTTQMTTNLTETTDGHYNGRILIWTSGSLVGQATDITGYLGSTKRLTYTAITEAPANGNTFCIV